MTHPPASLNIQLHDKFHLISYSFRNTDIDLLKCKYECVSTTYMQKEMPINQPEHTKSCSIFSQMVTNGDIFMVSSMNPIIYKHFLLL